MDMSRRTKLVVAALLALLVSGCGDAVSPEEYAVYLALLREGEPSRAMGPRVVREFTRAPLGYQPGKPQEWHDRTLKLLRKEMPGLGSDTFACFARRAARPARLEAERLQGSRVVLTTSAEHSKFFGESGRGWDAFHKQYPDSAGRWELSRVGFSADGRQALVCLGGQAGELVGMGSYHLLERIDGRWSVVGSATAWIS